MKESIKSTVIILCFTKRENILQHILTARFLVDLVPAAGVELHMYVSVSGFQKVHHRFSHALSIVAKGILVAGDEEQWEVDRRGGDGELDG